MPVFIMEHQTALTHRSVAMQLKRLAKQAGIHKNITPYLFRHSRIIHLIKENVSESVINLMMWGNLTTNMLQTYAHLTSKNIDNEMLRTHGITETETGEGKTELRIEPRQCPHYKLINGPMAEFCNSCGRSLTELATEAEDDIHDSILKNPSSLKRFITRLEDKMAKGEIVV
jgi:hypothetical protein